jgi:oxygen-independent coproporphyrinogen-3 oxidase
MQRSAFPGGGTGSGDERAGHDRIVAEPEPVRGVVAPDSVELAETASHWKSAYVHIPFCRRRCPYCDFAVVTPEEGGNPYDITRYVQALIAEIGMEPFWPALDAVNLGGGTPSSVPVSALEAVLDSLRRRFGLAPDAEISLEANPEDWEGEYAEQVRAAGFGRVSLGVQSFDAGVLAALGRWHAPEDGADAVRIAQAVGFESVSLDLIFGTPGETLDSWRSTVERALALQPDHLSAYSLTVERGTELSRRVLAGDPAPDPDDLADKYEFVAAAAVAAGMVRYEVSNWARPGHHCRYNLSTWGRGEYVAFGLGAHGHRRGIRRRNVRRLDVYLDRVARGERPEAGSDVVAGWPAEQERLMLGLRRTAGVESGEAGTALMDSAAGRRLAALGLVEVIDGRLRVADPLLTDAVVREVLALDAP